MIRNNLPNLISKSNKSLEQISNDTGIGLTQLKKYITSQQIPDGDADILIHYFKTNRYYFTGLWELAADQIYFSKFDKFFKDDMLEFIPNFIDVFQDDSNCFYGFWIQALQYTALLNNERAKDFFESLHIQTLENGTFITISDDDLIKAIKIYNEIIRYHYPSGGEYSPILTFKGQKID